MNSTIATFTRRTISALCIALVLWASTGCGFHLRGSTELSKSLPELSIVSSNTKSAIINELKRWLRASGITLSESADTILSVSNIKNENRPIAYDSRGKTALYELTKSLSISVTQVGKKLLIPTHIGVRQPYNYNESDTSAKDEEQALLEREMNAAIINRIIRHLEKLPFKRPAQ